MLKQGETKGVFNGTAAGSQTNGVVFDVFREGLLVKFIAGTERDMEVSKFITQVILTCD